MSRPQSPQTASKGVSGTRGRKAQNESSQRNSEPLVKSVLIEPRHNEPPRISVSVEYEGRAPDVRALKKAATDVLHDVMRAQTFVDLGERQNVQRGELTKCFSAEAQLEKGESE